ncbi:LLM class flavin-dependent oxidoreductase [Streptomyces seoulensis]|uniref:LLM class flavin-dependent oxidoreductase n=1 Tax=Streptomyces seoulensis TaxID=73044 RepID=UPI001FCB4D7E|nr:LLM class flavin-dependent oxidoreductase [Streptomyces seoulensis]
MRVGVVVLPEYTWPEARARWRAVEELGFDHAWTYDHLAWRSLAGEPWLGTVATLAAAAAVTSRIGLGTFVTSPNFRHPVPWSREVMALDEISGGRFLCGVGAGATDVDAVMLGRPPLSPKARVDRMTEFTGLLDRLLREDHVDFTGEYFTAVDARTVSGRVRRPRVPLIVAGSGPRTLRLARRLGDGWVTIGPEGADGEDRWWAGVERLAGYMDELKPEPGFQRHLSLDACPGYSLSSAARFAEMRERAAALGFTDVIVHHPRAEGVYAGRVAVLEEVAQLRAGAAGGAEGSRQP